MLREIISRKPAEEVFYSEEDNYFPTMPAKVKQSQNISRCDIFKIFTFNIGGILKGNNEFSAGDFFPELMQSRLADKQNTFKTINLILLLPSAASRLAGRNSSLIFPNNHLSFSVEFKSCSPDILKILYALCQSVYVSEKILPEFQNNLNRFIDVSEAWDIKNYLYVVSNSIDIQSQVKTSAETKQVHDSFGYDSEKFHANAHKTSKISLSLCKFFSQVSTVNQACFSQFGQYALKDHIQKNFQAQCSKWHTNQAILKGCPKLITGSKILAVKEFHKINTSLILDQLERKVMNNFQIFSFETIRNYNRRKDDPSQKVYGKPIYERQQGDKELERQREKQKNKEKERLKKLKKNILLPFLEAEETWIGRTDLFKQRYLQVRQKLEQEYDKILVSLNENEDKFILAEIDKMAANQNSLQALGNSGFDGLSINFSSFINKLKTCLVQSIKSSLTNKKWGMKNRSLGNKADLLSNLDSRIEINERKKETLETGIRLALKQYEYLSALMQPDRNKIKPFEIER